MGQAIQRIMQDRKFAGQIRRGACPSLSLFEYATGDYL
jgi:hypothetical protein